MIELQCNNPSIMRKFLLLMLTLVLSVNIYSQKEVCETPAEEDDLNSISVTKCTIKESKK